MHACKKQETPLIEAVDDGWPIPAELSGSLVPASDDASANVFDADVLDATDLNGGWSFAEGTSEHEPLFPSSPAAVPMRYGPAPLALARVLASDLQDEFSKPDLALGTDVDLPPPFGLWFAELRSVVPKRAPKPRATLLSKKRVVQEVNIQSCFTPREALVEPSTPTSEVDVKPRWWRRKSAR